MTMHCPACGSDRIHGSKSTLPHVVYREFGCMNCGLFESHPMNGDDYGQWIKRWQEPWRRKPKPAQEA
jgi:hypothetical protein